MRKPSWGREVAMVTQLREVKGPGLKSKHLPGRNQYCCGFLKVKNGLLYNVHLHKRETSAAITRDVCHGAFYKTFGNFWLKKTLALVCTRLSPANSYPSPQVRGSRSSKGRPRRRVSSSPILILQLCWVPLAKLLALSEPCIAQLENVVEKGHKNGRSYCPF